MQITATQAAKKPNGKPLKLTKRIGSTTYKVSVHFSKTSKETMGDKILRLIENETAQAQKTPFPIPYPDTQDHTPPTRPTAGKREQ